MSEKRTSLLDNTVGTMKISSAVDSNVAVGLVNSSQGAFLLSKALCLAIDTLDASDPDLENMILIRDHVFPLYLMAEHKIDAAKTGFGAMEALLEEIEGLEEKLGGRDDT